MVSVHNQLGNIVSSQLAAKSEVLKLSIESLSSGRKVNGSVADVTIGSLLSSQASILRTVASNAGRANNLLDTAKAGIDKIIELLERQKTLSIEAQDTTLTSTQRAQLNIESQSITDSINLIASSTKFNNQTILDGSISGAAAITSETGQAVENYTILSSAAFATSGTVAAGDLATSSTFGIVETQNVGKTAATATLTLTHDGGGALSADAVISVNGTAISFGDTETTASGLATSLVAALEASTDDEVRKFTYSASDGVVTITATELGTGANASTFEITDTNSGSISAATLGSDSITGGSVAIGSATGATAGTNRTVAADDRKFDNNVLGDFTDFAASYSTSGTQNEVTFTVSVNGTTYTSQAVTLFGTGGFNGKGNTIKSDQVITFTNTLGAKDASDEFTESAFTLTLGSSDVTVSGNNATDFQTALSNIATGFETQLDDVLVNQTRDLFLAVDDETAADFDIASASTTIFAGIHGFDRIGTNAAGDISLVSDKFGDDGSHGRIGSFAFDVSTHKITTTIDGEVFTADLSETTSDGANGFFDVSGGGGAAYNSSTNTLTFGNGIITFESANTTDNRQLKIDLSNVVATEFQANTVELGTTLAGYFDTIFGVSNNSQLSFQVGEDSTDVINVNIGNASASSLYTSDSGNSKTIDISTAAAALVSEDVLTNALNNARSIQANIIGSTKAFTSAESVNTTLASTIEGAASILLDTDFAEESVRAAELQALISLGSSLLGQSSANLNNILKLLDG